MRELLEILVARCQSIPGINEVRVFNNQLKNLPENHQFNFPAILIEPFDMMLKTVGGRYQDVEAGIRFHIVNESPNQGEEYDIYDTKDTVVQYLHLWTSGRFRPLMRSAESLDFMHNNVYDYKLEFRTGWKDLVPLVVADAQVTISSVTIDVDLDIDNPVVRSGDGIGYQFPDRSM